MHGTRQPTIAVICESRYRGRTEQFVGCTLRDGVSDAIWPTTKKNPFSQGLVGKYRLSRVNFEYEEAKSPSAVAYKEAVNRLLDRLPETPDLALVQTCPKFNQRMVQRIHTW